MRGTGLAGGPRAPDGSPVELFALLPPGPVPQLIDAEVPRGATILELGCGAGRVTHPLGALGHRVTAVDQSPDMLARVRAAEVVLADIEDLHLGRRFDAVVLASFLVNTPEASRRRQFLDACARHVDPGGVVLIQRLDPELVPLAVDAESEEGGITYAMTDVRHDGGIFAATMGFTVGDRHWEHGYEARVLDDQAIDEELERSGLSRGRWLDSSRTWLSATVRPAAHDPNAAGAGTGAAGDQP